MRFTLQVIIIVLIFGCSPKIATQTKSDFQKVNSELKSIDNNYSTLKEKFPNLQVYERTIINSEATTKREMAAIKLSENQITDLIINEDESCGLIKVVKVQPNAKMRVSYIYLGDTTPAGEKLADKILAEYQNGKSFATLAKQYSKDGNGEKGGDLNWFDEKNMIKDFTQAIRKHKKGDVFKTPTKEYGWYVISYTHEFKERIEYEIIEIVKENCGK